MKPNEIRGKAEKEIVKMIEEKEGELFGLKLKLRTGQLAKTGDVSKVRVDIARMRTILNEKSKEKVN